MTILDQLAEYARARTEQAKKKIQPRELRRQALSLPKGNFAFENALKKPDVSLSVSAKKLRPLKVLLFPNFRICKLQRNTRRQEQTASRY